MKCEQCGTTYTYKERFTQTHYKTYIGRWLTSHLCSIECMLVFLLDPEFDSSSEQLERMLEWYTRKYRKKTTKEDNQ